VSPQDFGCGKYVEDSKKDPYRGSESYNCSCLYQNDESWEIDHNSKECHFHVIFTPNYGVTQTWAVSSFFISLVIAGLYVLMFASNIAPTTIPPYNKGVFALFLLLFVVIIISFFGMSVKINLYNAYPTAAASLRTLFIIFYN